MRGKVECLYTVGKNINVWKEKVRTRIFGSKGREFNVSTDKGWKSNVDKKRGQNSSVWKDHCLKSKNNKNRTRILVCGRIRSEFRCLKE